MDLPCRLRPVFIFEVGVSPGVHAYRGRGYVCVTLQLYGQSLCGGRFASGREKGAGVCCTGVGASLRVRVGCAAGAGQVRVGDGCALQEGVCLQSGVWIAKVRKDGTVVLRDGRT